MSEHEKVVETATRTTRMHRGISRRLRAAGWGLFFIWVGFSLLMDLSWSVGLIGVAAIIFLGQTARISFGRRLEVFWVVVGGLFLLGGIWELYRIDVQLMPILLILAGGALLLSMFRRRRHSGWWSRSENPDRGDRSSEARTGRRGRSLECCGWRC